MTRPLRIALATPYGQRLGAVERLADDELSLILDDSSPSPWRSGTCAFSLRDDEGGPPVWGTLEVAPVRGGGPGRLRGRILSVNPAQRARLAELVAAGLPAREPAPTPAAVSSLPPSMPRSAGPRDARGPESVVTQQSVHGSPHSHTSVVDLHLSDPAEWTSLDPDDDRPVMPVAGRRAIRAALRHSLSDARWGAHRSAWRGARLRQVLDRKPGGRGSEGSGPEGAGD